MPPLAVAEIVSTSTKPCKLSFLCCDKCFHFSGYNPSNVDKNLALVPPDLVYHIREYQVTRGRRNGIHPYALVNQIAHTMAKKR